MEPDELSASLPEQLDLPAASDALAPQAAGAECPTCAMAAYATSYVYALGQIEARFPSRPSRS